MKKVKIFLDDVRDCPEGWSLRRTAKDLLSTLKVINWDMIEIISFDHDLGEEVPTGYDVLKYMETEIHEGREKYIPTLVIHSANPVGRQNMTAAITSMQNHLKK